MTTPVSPTQARLLSTVRAVLRQPSLAELRPLVTPPGVTKPGRRHAKIGPTAMRLMCDSIRVGSVRALVQHGGWHRRAFLRADSETRAHGRLWDDAPELQLRFSAASYQLFRWLCGADCELTPETVGDGLLFRLAADAVVRCGHDPTPLLVAPLACLAHADRAELDPTTIDWSTLLSPDGIVVLEGSCDALTGRWVAMERAKGEVDNPATLAATSQRQSAVFAAFLEAVDTAERPDLATFAVRAAKQLAHRPAYAWVAALNPTSTLTLRSQAARDAAGFLRQLAQVSAWNEALSTVPFFEGEYARAQLTVAQWEPLGREGFSRIQQIVGELESGRCLIARDPSEPS